MTDLAVKRSGTETMNAVSKLSARVSLKNGPFAYKDPKMMTPTSNTRRDRDNSTQDATLDNL